MASSKQVFEDFATAVFERVLRRRKRRAPLFLAIYGGGGAAITPIALIEAMRRRLTRDDGRSLVPHVVVKPGASVAEKIQGGLKVPGGWGKLRFPQYQVFEAVGEKTDSGMEAEDRAFKGLHPSLYRFMLQPAGADAISVWFRRCLFVLVFACWLEQLRFGWSWRRRMRQGWFPEFAGGAGGDFFNRAATLMQGSDERRKEALLRALLCDMDAAFTRRLSPWRRRRRSGFMLFVENDDELADLIEKAAVDTEVRHITVVSARSGSAEHPLSLDRATLQLMRGEDTKFEVTTASISASITADELAANSKIKARPGNSAIAGLVAFLQVVLPCAGGLAAANEFGLLPWRRDVTCIGETTGHGSVTSAGVLSPEDATRLYNEDKKAIEAENNRVRDLARTNPEKKYTIKTVVYLGSGVTGVFDDGVAYNGVIPEMRGIRLAQRKMNELAERNPRTKDNLSGNVFVVVDIREAGKDYAQAPEIARQVVQQSTETVLGVIGLGESRQQTLDALKILGDGGLPMLGMGATSEDMQKHPLYRQISYDNPYQTSMFKAFVRQANIIRVGGSDDCAPAGNAVVIGDPTDNYSLRLAENIAAEFGIDRDRVIWYPRPGEVISAHPKGTLVSNDTELIEKTCGQLQRSPDDTVIFWPGRAERLRDFLDKAKDSGACPPWFTVVSGADLTTTAVLKERFPTSFDKVTLYYAAHALVSRPPNSAGIEYDRRYVDTYKTRNDAWYDHWRGPVAYDGLVTMATGINTVCRENGPAGCGRGSVASHLRYRIGGRSGLRGATGILRFVKDPWSTAGFTPIEKRFLMLRATPAGPSVVMECGHRDTDDRRTAWGPANKFECPDT
ncbi:hypothetical protein [Nonomuraea sp. NPDC049480]|uniref:hypothetical protein n=1 Tax=Nonomuraea sp. NPDC049480 TaxID=3364353 RepID=UPI0037AD77C7